MRLRGKPLQKWTPLDVINDVEAAFFGDADKLHVRAAIVLNNAYQRLPRKRRQEWEAAAAAEHGGRIPPLSVYKFDFDDGDRVGLYMEGDKSVLVREIEGVFGTDEGRAVALDWVREPNTETALTHIPGVYVAALIETVTGVERLWNEESMSWYLPGDPGPPCVFRRYPPGTDEDSSQFTLMNVGPELRNAKYLAFLASPTLQSELK